MRFRDTAEFGPTIDTVAEALGISATAVEKDYWVSEVLRILTDTHPEDFIFKGGTSVSKGYGIIERFSEDIDILVLPRDRGRGAIDKLMKAMGETAAAGIGGHAQGMGAAETGRHRSFAVHYPTTRPPTSLISTSVLLEIGVRGGTHPHEGALIRSLLATALKAADTDLAGFEDLAPFEASVLHPARTLLEKLVHIHQLAIELGSDERREPDGRSGRHFYDVHKLLADQRVLERLQDKDETRKVISSIDEITRMYFHGKEGSSGRPSAGFASSPAFDPATPVYLRLRRAYENTMPELYYGRDPLPTWDDICASVTRNAGLL